jgi:rubredoxin
MEKHVCPCGEVYDPEKGDMENGIPPRTPWERVPPDWTCPKCGKEKDEFKEVIAKL